jgi:hypothetical protein
MSEGTEACLDWMELTLVLAVLVRDCRMGLIPGQNIRLQTGDHLAMKPYDSRGGESAHGMLWLSYPIEFLTADWPRFEGKRIVADDPIIPVARSLRF